MPGQVLYSTNTRLKFIINQKFRKDQHYVWCSDCFDSTKENAYTLAALQAPSSDPCAIYKLLSDECRRLERHSDKINQQKMSLTALAAQWRDSNEITASEAEEIVYMVENADKAHWRPLLYVIPRAPVAARLKLVPVKRRASFSDEYILEDLKRSEFDVVELG